MTWLTIPPGDSSPGDPAPVESRVLSDRYRLVFKLGSGGMGSVWLAEDMLLERSVALKELVQHAGDSDLDLSERRMRALQEARAMARVRHPAIVPIHDVFFIDDDPWIVMEYISGRSLQDLIKDQALDDRSIARIGLHVLRGLNAVHSAGVVHRDVKPTNILVADDDSIFLVDFGIARIAGDTSLTRKSILGTPDFLAPERFKTGYKASPPTDIWALGVTFYYALEGYSPFWRDSERSWEATLSAILHEAPLPPSRGGRLADITLRMLHKETRRRATAGDVLKVLEDIAGEPAVPPPLPAPQPPPPRQPPASSQPQPELPVVDMAGPGVGPVPGGPRFDEAREAIKNVGTDTGVAMLLAMPVEDAARILADCPSRLCGTLLQGIAAARPATAHTLLRLLRSGAAGRAFAYLRPDTAASLLTAMTHADALRVLDSTDARTVAAVIVELAVPTSTALLKSMSSRQRAAQVLTHVRPVTAAELLRSDAEFAGTVLRHLNEPVRRQVSRHLLPEREGQD